MKKFTERLLTFWHWLLILPRIFTSRINLRHLLALKEGRNPFPEGSPMDFESQFSRLQTMMELLNIEPTFFFDEEYETYDICDSNQSNQKVRIILVPNGLTIKEFIEKINCSYVPFRLVLSGNSKADSFTDLRSNKQESYLLFLDEFDFKSGWSDSMLVTNNTILEILLYYAIKYFETGEFINEDVDTICKASVRGDHKATVKLTRKTQHNQVVVEVEIDHKYLIGGEDG